MEKPLESSTSEGEPDLKSDAPEAPDSPQEGAGEGLPAPPDAPVDTPAAPPPAKRTRGKGKKKKRGAKRAAKAPAKRGRKRQVIDETVRAAVVSAIELNVKLEDAATFAGFSYSTLIKYQALGVEALEKPESERDADERDYAAFAQAIKAARVRYKLRNLQNIQTHSGDSWQASAWLLERSFPDEYARREPKPQAERPTAVTLQVVYPESAKAPEIVVPKEAGE